MKRKQPHRQIRVVLSHQGNRTILLPITRPKEHVAERHGKQRHHHPPLPTRKPRRHARPRLQIHRHLASRPPSRPNIGRQPPQSHRKNHQPHQHPSPSHGKSVMPARRLTRRRMSHPPHNQRRNQRPQIDADIENRISPVDPRIARRIQPANLRRDIRLEETHPHREHQQPDKKQRRRGEQKLARRHYRRPQQNRPALPQKPVRHRPAGQSPKIRGGPERSHDQSRQRLRPQRPIQTLEEPLRQTIPDNPRRLPTRQQEIHQVIRQQRTVAVITEPLPHLGPEQNRQPDRVAQETLLSHGARLLGNPQQASTSFLKKKAKNFCSLSGAHRRGARQRR